MEANGRSERSPEAHNPIMKAPHRGEIKFRKSVFRPYFFRVRFSGVRQIPVQEFLCNKIPVYHFPIGIFASVVFSGVTFPVGVDFRRKVPVKEKCQ